MWTATFNEPYFYPKRQGGIMIGPDCVGYVGQIHPATLEGYDVDQELFGFEIDLSRLVRIVPARKKHRPILKFPVAKRDIAILVPESTPILSIIFTIERTGAPILKNVHPFDIFRSDKFGEGMKSVAFSLEFGIEGRTLTDEETERAVTKILAGLEEECGASLRG
jgi:phenylalanyl-tRNA synthetase beta chain